MLKTGGRRLRRTSECPGKREQVCPSGPRPSRMASKTGESPNASQIDFWYCCAQLSGESVWSMGLTGMVGKREVISWRFESGWSEGTIRSSAKKTSHLSKSRLCRVDSRPFANCFGRDPPEIATVKRPRASIASELNRFTRLPRLVGTSPRDMQGRIVILGQLDTVLVEWDWIYTRVRFGRAEGVDKTGVDVRKDVLWAKLVVVLLKLVTVGVTNALNADVGFGGRVFVKVEQQDNMTWVEEDKKSIGCGYVLFLRTELLLVRGFLMSKVGQFDQ